MGDGDSGAALPQRLNSRQRRREQQEQQQGQEQQQEQEQQESAASGGEGGAAQQATTVEPGEQGFGLGEGGSGAAPPGAGREPVPGGADQCYPGLRSGPVPEEEPGGLVAGVEVEAVSTLEPLPEYRSAAVGDYKFECECH